MNFQTFQATDSVFSRVINPLAWAAEIKAAEKVPSLKVTNILQGKDDAKYCIVTLSDGRSDTLPVSKKAVVGSPITDYFMAESETGWVVVTGQGSHSTQL